MINPNDININQEINISSEEFRGNVVVVEKRDFPNSHFKVRNSDDYCFWIWDACIVDPNDSRFCEHEYVNVSLFFNTFVCKKCNIERD